MLDEGGTLFPLKRLSGNSPIFIKKKKTAVQLKDYEFDCSLEYPIKNGDGLYSLESILQEYDIPKVPIQMFV